MYDWIDVLADESRQVLTASRRLARTLRAALASRQVDAGRVAWATPDIDEWHDWALAFVTEHAEPSSLPILISPYQCKLLWENCLRREIKDPLFNVAQLARQARDTWLRLQDWCVPIKECQRRARNKDQWLFAKAAARYQSILDREGWVDASGMAGLVIDLVSGGSVSRYPDLTLAGFDRVPPRLTQLIAAYRDAGGKVEVRESATERDSNGKRNLVAARNSDAELRAAGRWARQVLYAQPDARVAIVVTQLEKDAQRSLRLIKEGLIPGWQNAGEQQQSAVNMSYGRKLAEYPAIAIALLLLNWLNRDLSTTDISRLLRSTVLAEPDDDYRIRAELEMRRLPEQNWSAAKLLRSLQRGPASLADSGTALHFVEKIAAHGNQLPKRQSPAAWVIRFNALLQELGWPGRSPLSSAEFQTINRWRELLNEIARLELVSDVMTLAEVLSHLSAVAAETLFQPEGPEAPVNVMGPLEAAGLEFDALWVTGASSTNWPPPGNPLALLSRDLQRDFAFPDAVPADTVQYAERIIDRLAGSAPTVVFSYPALQSDAEQTVSTLLAQHGLQATEEFVDPGWQASRLVCTGLLTSVADDPVPPAVRGEKIHGGAATIQRQFVEPFAAFASGRLGIRTLWPIEPGLSASIRGSLIHDALHRLYIDQPMQQEILAWSQQEIARRTAQAVDYAFANHVRNADMTLGRLLDLEKERVKGLLHGVVEQEAYREPFEIAAVELALDTGIAGLELSLRIDRVDRDSEGNNIVIDYKTGSPKRLLNREKEPKDMQLVVYAMALTGRIGGIALLNVDSRQISLDAAGYDFPAKVDWEHALPSWIEAVEAAAGQIARGDVRINVAQSIQASRPLGLLSRFRELQLEQ